MKVAMQIKDVYMLEGYWHCCQLVSYIVPIATCGATRYIDYLVRLLRDGYWHGYQLVSYIVPIAACGATRYIDYLVHLLRDGNRGASGILLCPAKLISWFINRSSLSTFVLWYCLSARPACIRWCRVGRIMWGLPVK